jgi:hypothetical protein
MINNLGIGVVELSLNHGGDAHCGNSLDKAAPRQCQTVIFSGVATDRLLEITST